VDLPLLWLRSHELQINQLEPETGYPLNEFAEGSLIRQVGVQGRRAWAYDDRAVVKFCAYLSVRLTSKSNLISPRLHHDYPLVANLS
jgi:hypothetical protein